MVFSTDLINWDHDLNDSVSADAGESTTTPFSLYGLDLPYTVFFRVENVEIQLPSKPAISAHDHGICGRVVFRMGQADHDAVHPPVFGQFSSRTVKKNLRLAAFLAHYLHVEPTDFLADSSSESLSNRLLGCKSGGKVKLRTLLTLTILAFGSREYPRAKTFPEFIEG